MEDLKYPIGEFRFPESVTDGERALFLEQIAEAPARLRRAISGLSDEQLATPYRPGGWTVRQVVHHLPDSHLNSYARFKLAMTEDDPTIRPFDEARWAELEDAKHGPLEFSLALLDALHERWVSFLRSLKREDYARTFHHPEFPDTHVTLDRNIALYAWHGRHHVAHITALRERNGWI